MPWTRLSASRPNTEKPGEGDRMSHATIVQYETRPDGADENERLVRAVFVELAADDPGHPQYAAFRLDDGMTFVHVAAVGDENPLSANAAFGAFQAGLADRCIAPSAPAQASLVGSSGLEAA